MSFNRCVGVSNQLQLFAKEQERNKLLYSSAPQILDTESASHNKLSTSKGAANQSCKTPSAKKLKSAGESQHRDAEEGQQFCHDQTENVEDEKLDGKCDETNEKSGAKRREEEEYVTRKQTEPGSPITQSAQDEGKNLLDPFKIFACHSFSLLIKYQICSVLNICILLTFL